MRACLTLAAFLMSFASLAHADTYDFSVELCGPSQCGPHDEDFEFRLNVPPSPDSFDATSFTYNHVDILQEGISAGDGPSVSFTKYGFDVFGFYNPMDTFSISEYDDDFALFSGSTSDPVILTGGPSYVNPQHSYYAYGNGGFTGYLTVTDLDAVPTPEPSSLALLGTGLLGAVGAVRKHFAS